MTKMRVFAKKVEDIREKYLQNTSSQIREAIKIIFTFLECWSHESERKPPRNNSYQSVKWLSMKPFKLIFLTNKGQLHHFKLFHYPRLNTYLN